MIMIVTSSKTSPIHKNKPKSALIVPGDIKNIVEDDKSVDNDYEISKTNNRVEEKPKKDSNSKIITLNLDKIQESNNSKYIIIFILTFWY